MSFYVAPTPSPPVGENQGHGAIEEDALTSVMHSALHAFTSNTSHTPSNHTTGEHGMLQEKSKTSLEIIVEPEILCLKGTGPDVEPALLSGHVVLHLTESTSIKGISLSFRGKARLPAPTHEPLSLNSSASTYSICSHEWSFLEGEKKHSHTLKAGRHLFPFQLQIGGSLPSSMATTILGGASIQYKLRAIAVRPGLAHNLQAVAPVTIIRSFSPEALEYQQTLEIENTWPEKLMYSIMIPHKAWAIGDKLTALAKFSPLAKGARVLYVTASIHETTKLYVRQTCQEHTRVVATTKHEIIGHHAVSLEDQNRRVRNHHSYSTHSTPGTPALTSEQQNLSSGSMAGYFGSIPSSGSTSSPASIPEEDYAQVTSMESDYDPNLPEDQQLNRDDVVSHLTITIPIGATPTHTLEPVVISHRIRWSILISNQDGHTSELRCSLPLHLLENRLYHESRVHTAATRRLLLGGPEVSDEARDEIELPSYRAHVYDRVANMFMPDAATMRVTNPWVHHGSNPVIVRNILGGSTIPSGASSPLDAHPISSHLPHVPGSGPSTPLDWVNSELLLSLSQDEPPPLIRDERHSPPQSSDQSQPGSRAGSSRPSRWQSRAPSPDHHHRSPHTPSTPNETFVHSGSHASRDVHSVLRAAMKPLSSSTSWLPTRSGSHSNLSNLVASNTEHQLYHHQQQIQHGNQSTVQLPDAQSSSALLHRAFTEVPDYGIASRGFLGGVPPLSSVRDLPSYDEAERSHSDSNVASRFAQAMRHERQQHSLPLTPAS